MFNGLTGWHFLAILVILLLLFGATRLPALARSLGQSMNAFKSEMKPKDGEPPVDGTTNETVSAPAPTSQVPATHVTTTTPSSDPTDPIDKATRR
jgi:sec-independent protein translocase protein TatA